MRRYLVEIIACGVLRLNAKRQVCLRLSGREKDVHSLGEELGLSPSTLSQHLAKLHRLGMVSVRNHVQFRYYTCDHPGVLRLLKILVAASERG
ncbi:ArsR/SmtB family transcription factor [Rhizobium sp. BR 315]|uniref:ArsR/SmtB family transcription factor n=1 Tax=Rhizobium sp. BR 315 TaxID=3040014 RepID=UPI003D343997